MDVSSGMGFESGFGVGLGLGVEVGVGVGVGSGIPISRIEASLAPKPLMARTEISYAAP